MNRTEIWVGALAVAAFLVLYWTLRGAPPGQSATTEDDDDAPKSGYRDRVVAAVVTGLVLILVGAYVAATRSVPWSLPIFAMGFGLVLALVMVNQRYRHSSPSLRRTIEYSNAILNTALLAGVLIVANVIAFRYGGHVIDLTRERTYSLSSLSMNQIRGLDQPLTFHLIAGRGARACASSTESRSCWNSTDPRGPRWSTSRASIPTASLSEPKTSPSALPKWRC